MKYQLDRTKYLNDEELSHLKRITDNNSRDALLIKTALATGARAQELLNIEKNDLIESNRSVYIYGLKNSNNREIPIEKSLFNALKELSLNSKSEKVFGIGYPRLAAIWNEYKPANKSFHTLRHTFAIELYKRTEDLRLVRLALGHVGLENTMIYANYLYSQRELRKLLVDKK
jgi:integrase/recombinase XerC